MKVQDIMTKSVETLSPTTTLRKAARRMADLNIGSIPVVDQDGHITGIITDRDISVYAIAMGHDPQSTEIQKVMTKTVYTCRQDQDIGEAAEIMEQQNIRRLAVVDDNKTVAGFLSVDDLVRYSHELAGAVLDAATPSH